MMFHFNDSEFAWCALCNVFDPVQTKKKNTIKNYFSYFSLRREPKEMSVRLALDYNFSYTSSGQHFPKCIFKLPL